MKQNFDTSALRQTAAEIQGAVKPKSITPDMVGGLFSALVEAQGEVIEALGALEREVVTVKVNGYDGEQRVSAAGAKVYVDIFSIGSVPTVALPRQELTANEEGIVTFEVFKGYQYAVFSKIEGLGASFQFTYMAGQDARTIELWNMPIGVFMCGYAAYCDDNTGGYRCVPYVTAEFCADSSMIDLEWDVQGEEYCDESGNIGVLVSTEQTSFLIEQKNKSEEELRWANYRLYSTAVPTLPLCPIDTDKFDGDWDAAWQYALELARQDFDGNLNTAMILSFDSEAPAAKFCAGLDSYNYRQMFLPSAGQLYLMYVNKDAINRLMSAANDEGGEYELLDDWWYWSSTQESEFCAWNVGMINGYTYHSNKYNYNYVRAVSAFHFIY